ncbi:MAG: hypothetical protein IPL65_11370 [Lewinellaceae bacterium]|nr:hypothetical protein [Lewinellaceae bacterium]
MNKKLILSAFLIQFVLFSSCGQKDDAINKAAVTTPTQEQPVKPRHSTMHEYGGWYCPDNLFGFPAVNIKELDKVPVVHGRLPTEEETRNGTSLMYIDPAKVPNASALDMPLPRLARYYSEHSKKNELVIVIQAVMADQDTVVGFRYVNGGNGSAWFDEVAFLTEGEIAQLPPTPFVSENVMIKARKEKIWEILTSPIYARALGDAFGQNVYVESNWNKNGKVYQKKYPGEVITTGNITALWEDTYIQVDYTVEGRHYVEKFLILENPDTHISQLNIVSGPYGDDFAAKKTAWNKWLQKVKALSEL